MPRRARVVLPDVALHLVQRGANRAACFFAERDYLRYLELLSRFGWEFGCSIHAYCLMTNHVHLLLTPHHPGACAKLMKHVNQCYVQALNKALGRSGPLWEGRFHSALVSSDRYALACYRYIELNPVTAGMVVDAGDYRWSSYSANAEGRYDPLLHAHPTYAALGEFPETRRSAYRSLFQQALASEEVEAIRRATRSGQRVGDPPRQRGRRPRKK